jgi:hypothetical protein
MTIIVYLIGQDGKGENMKFYIWLNGASQENYYWKQSAQNWTSNASEATLFKSEKDAIEEAKYAEDYSDGEVEVRESR